MLSGLEYRSTGFTLNLMLFPLHHPLSLSTAQQTVNRGGEEGSLFALPRDSYLQPGAALRGTSSVRLVFHTSNEQNSDLQGTGSTSSREYRLELDQSVFGTVCLLKISAIA